MRPFMFLIVLSVSLCAADVLACDFLLLAPSSASVTHCHDPAALAVLAVEPLVVSPVVTQNIVVREVVRPRFRPSVRVERTRVRVRSR